MSVGINPLKTATQNDAMTGLRLESKNLQQQLILNLLLWKQLLAGSSKRGTAFLAILL